MNETPDSLIHGFLDGTLNRDELAELNQLLAKNQEIADRFAHISTLHHSLQSGFRSGAIATKHTHAATNTPGRKSPFLSLIQPALPWLLATAAAIVAISALRLTPITTAPTQTAALEKQDTGFAILTHTVETTWTHPPNPSTGDILRQGLIEFKSGLARIEFFSGVTLVVEGDSSLEIISPDEMRLIRGKLRVHVPPPAIGFQIHTPQGTVLDLGTEFALDVAGDHSELHVIDGEVEWHADSESNLLLTRGQALKLTGDTSSPINADPDRFTGSARLAQKINARQAQRFTNWQTHSQSLKSNPNLIAHFAMDQLDPWVRELKPSGSQITPGTIIGAKVVPGRWPRKQALDFSPNGSRIRVNISGEHQEITFATWAKIDSLDRQFNALFLTDNYGLGEPHWQLLEDGRLFFSVGIGKEKFHHIFHSPTVWDHTDCEQWLHLVTTYDVASRTCTHYLNGKEISHASAPPEKGVEALIIGNAQIGNWGLPTREEPDFAVRNLNGRLDEFTIYNSILTSQEIQSLYQIGKP